jgi:COP9 signalosome complex subunit 6
MTTEVKVHPIVLVSIADGFVRNKVQFKKAKHFGVLMGFQSGRSIELVEILDQATREDGSPKIDAKLNSDIKFYEKVFPEYSVLGWFTAGVEPTQQDKETQQAMRAYCDSPYLLMWNPSTSSKDEIPIKIFEDCKTGNFKLVSWTLEADETEALTMDFASMLQTEKSGSAVTQSYPPLVKAIKEINVRLTALCKILQDHASGVKAVEPTVLRQINALVQRIPIMDSVDFRREFQSDYNDALLITLLSNLTKTSSQVSDVMDKFNLAYGEKAQIASSLAGMDAGFGGMGMMGMMSMFTGGGGARRRGGFY